MTIFDKARQAGIDPKKKKQTCPKCSGNRKNKRDRCLSVKIESDCILFKCHHCGWSGAIFEDNGGNNEYNKMARGKEFGGRTNYWSNGSKRIPKERQRVDENTVRSFW